MPMPLRNIEVWNEVNGDFHHADHGRMFFTHADAMGAVDWSKSPIRLRSFICRGRPVRRVVQYLAGAELTREQRQSQEWTRAIQACIDVVKAHDIYGHTVVNAVMGSLLEKLHELQHGSPSGAEGA